MTFRWRLGGGGGASDVSRRLFVGVVVHRLSSVVHRLSSVAYRPYPSWASSVEASVGIFISLPLRDRLRAMAELYG